ncbi:hypothetical protein L2505_02985 [Lactobacillus gasseri]|nr:hypothetical protein [Lactobacillus gasseri]MCZ3759988.1 hypothetical protein [Lactobacillus gasseri]MCZ3761691.1 hypothetical protein [Lactobacillus gasseri]MCZ3765191.1 hypothetical protein [Lactobacillus gasseri]MCZ3767824.1 hypothetical protein [Lactobacillus gasseri]
MMEYKAYHGTPDGYIAPGYYDDDNMFHATMTVDEWIKKNRMPSRDEMKRKMQSSIEDSEIEDKDIDSEDTNGVSSSKIENSGTFTSSSKSSKSKSSYKKLKIVNKNEIDKDKAEKHSPWIIGGLAGIVLVGAMFSSLKNFGERFLVEKDGIQDKFCLIFIN